MSYVSAIVDRVHFVRWIEPTDPDVEPVVRELEAARERLGPPTFGIAIIPVECKLPSDDLRTKMGKQMPRLLAACEIMLFVIEGTGFRQSIMRSAVTAVLFVGKSRGRVFVHPTIESALTQIQTRLSAPVREVLSRAALLGVARPSREDGRLGVGDAR